ncbi:MAG: hypothetical protein JWO95_2171 [Verrucomicrobiales bacterium]|nr:hypothetical protein [Verrucomicrobiales bacterium]
MPEPDLFLFFVRPLNQIGVRYMVSGGMAAILYGEPRLTNDVDLVVFLRTGDISRLTEVFPQNEFYVPPREIISDQVAQGDQGHFNLIHLETGYKADFYPSGSDELTAWGFRHSRKLQLKGEQVVVAPPEYVIVRKLEYFREGGSDKHLRDIRSMLAVSAEIIDRSVVGEWVQKRGLEIEWDRL